MSEIPALPNDILLKLFKRLPLLHLFKSIGLVCKRWRALLYEHELLTRKTLVLFPTLDHFRYYHGVVHYLPNDEYHWHLLQHVKKEDGSPWMQPLPTEAQIRFNLMPVRHFISDEMIIERNIMPNITHLTIIDEYSDMKAPCECTIRLIRHWSHNLTSLKLSLYTTLDVEYNKDVKKIPTLFEVLNNIPTLRHLDLKVDIYDRLPDNFRFSFLSHLHTFCFEIRGRIFEECLFSSLCHYQNDNLKICCHRYQVDANKLLQLEPQLAKKFTQFHIVRMEQFCDRFLTLFTSLTLLSLKIRQPYMMTKLSQQLQLLQNLVGLKLEYAEFDKKTQWSDPLGQYEHYCPVASVRLLVIDIRAPSHRDIAKLCIPVIFPNVQVMQLHNASRICLDCDYGFMDYYSGIKTDKVNECARMCRESFGDCAKLHSFNPYNEYSELNQFELNQYDCQTNATLEITTEVPLITKFY